MARNQNRRYAQQLLKCLRPDNTRGQIHDSPAISAAKPRMKNVYEGSALGALLLAQQSYRTTDTE
jgi:hypothetical protein